MYTYVPREKDFCVWCGQATSHDAVEEIKEDPEFLDDIERAQDVLTVFENRPDLLEDAERNAPDVPTNQPRAPTRPERAASTQAGFASVD